MLLDGRSAHHAGYESGNFVKPTVIDDLPAASDLADTEIFGPVLAWCTPKTGRRYRVPGTKRIWQRWLRLSPRAALRRGEFRYEAPTGNIGINIGVAAPMAYFPFSGWKDSFFGIMHGQGRDAIEFYTEKKVVVERWAKEHWRKF